MNERMRAGMFEATRLTRAGQLLEATATIQRTLRGLLEPDAAYGSDDKAADSAAEGSSRLLKAEPFGEDGSLREPDRRFHTAPMAILPPPGGSAAADRREPWSAEPAESDQPAGVSERLEAGAGESGSLSRLRARLRPHWRHQGGLAARPGSRPSRAPGVVPDGGRFITGSYTNLAGIRSYRLYIPSSYCGQALPLIVMLHGCTQTPDDFAAGTRMNELAEEHHCLVLYPAQAPAANRMKCWNWFKRSDQHRDQGEPSLIAGITRQIVEDYHLDAQRVYVAGLSAGGAMAVIMGMTYPDLYAAIGTHSGLAYALAQDLPSALAAMQQGKVAQAGQPDFRPRGVNPSPRIVPAIVFHGDQDTTVHSCNGEQIIAQWTTIHAAGEAHPQPRTRLKRAVQRGQVADGHAYTRTLYHDAGGRSILEQWLVHGAGHAWSGGSPRGSFTDPQGPDSAREMIRFFYEHPQPELG